MMARINDAFDDYIAPKSYSTVDEQAKRAQAAADAAAQQVGYGGNVGSSVTNQVSNVNNPTAGIQTGSNFQTETELALKNKAVKPDAPDGFHYTWIGGTNTGSWTLYKDAPVATLGAGAGAGAGAGSGTDAATAAANLIASQNAAAIAAEQQAGRQSAYDTLYNEFNKYGLGSLVESIKGMITDAKVSPSQFAIALQNTKEYQQRFSANQDRIKAGLRALSPAEYIAKEDAYQNIMRNYGLPASYYAKDALGTQAGFNKLLANDVSDVELEDRVATAQQRVLNSNPEVLKALKQFYPDINNADILAYALDPQNALTNIKRKVTAAEIGGAALAQGLQANGGTAESLAGLGITKAQAQQGYTNVAEMVPRGSQLADIYGQQPYNQQTAEAEVFNTAGAADAAARRKKLTALEQAQFGGSSGVGALGRDKAIYGATQGQSGLY